MAERRIHVACLASYNNGRLYGRWIDVDGKDGDELREEVAEMLRGSPYPNVEVDCPTCEDVDSDGCQTCGGRGKVPSAEEFAIHDHEGFGRIIGEYTSLDDVAAAAEALDSDAEDTRRGFRWLVEDRGFSISEAARRAEDVRTFDGEASDYAEDFARDCYSEALEGPLGSYIDFERLGRDMVLGGDIDEADIGGERFLVTNANEF